MKKVIKAGLLSVFVLSAIFASGQKLKFGHTDMQAIVAEMPEMKEAQQKLEAEAKKIENRLVEMQTEYQKKVEEYMQNENLKQESPEKWDALTKADKEAEIQSLQTRIQQYQGSAQETLAKKQNELFKPVSDKFKAAVKEVAEAEGLIYVQDISTLLYFSPTQSIDITDKVKAKLAAKGSN